MPEVAIILFKKVYQDTGSVEAALLELKRIGWTQAEAVAVLTSVFEVTSTYAETVVANSVAWT